MVRETTLIERDVRCTEELRELLVEKLALPFTFTLETGALISIKVIVATGGFKYLVMSGPDGFICLPRRRITDDVYNQIKETLNSI